MKKKMAIRVLTACLLAGMGAGMLTGCGMHSDMFGGKLQVTSDAANGSSTGNSNHHYSSSSSGKLDYSEMDGEAVVYESAPSEYYPTTNSVADVAPSVESCYEEGYYGEYINEYGSNESYANIRENRFLSVSNHPFSTFSADVDTASYANIRRMLMDGYDPSWIDEDAVRIEEMINYFSYDYEKPARREPFSVNSEIVACPWNEDNYLLRIGLATEEIDFDQAPASNLVFLIDVSGSMYSEDKLPLLQKAFEMLCTNLSAKDRVSIVTYAGDDEIVIQGVRGNDTDTIVNAIESLSAGGSTNGSEGIKTAYELAEEYFIEGGNNRIILATDGDLNVGVTSNEGLESLISNEKESGVFLSVLGFGTGNIKDDKMELLADKGNGNYSYIDSLREAKKVLVNEMGATLITVAKDVKFQLEFNEDVVASYRQIGYENRALADEDFADDTKDAGEVGAGSSVTVLYEIELAQKNAIDSDEWCTLHVRYKEPSEDESKELKYNIGAADYSSRISANTAMAAAVAEFGMVLRESRYAGNSSYDSIMDLLDEADIRGDEYKEEFCELVDIYYDLVD